MNIERIELGEIGEFLDSKRVPVTESDRKPGPYPYYGANGQQGWIDGFIFDEPLILLAEDGGAFGSKTKPIAYKVTGKCWVNNHAHVLRPYSNCDVNYLCHILSLYDVTKYVNGTTRQKLTKSEAEQIPIPFPPLPEQRRTAALLDKADRLRRTRRYAAQLSDTFLQAVFVRMFGDPVWNPMGWDVEYFGDVCETRLGKMLDAKQQTGKHLRPYLRNVNVKWGQIDLADLQEMDFDEADREEFRLQSGDVMICEGGEVGRAAIWNDELPECYFQKALHRARPNPDKATPEFVIWLMWILANSGGLVQSVSEVTFAHLTGVRLKELKVPLPPLALQQKFARIVQQFECLRAQQREAERQAEHLFQTLLHRAFSGEG